MDIPLGVTKVSSVGSVDVDVIRAGTCVRLRTGVKTFLSWTCRGVVFGEALK